MQVPLIPAAFKTCCAYAARRASARRVAQIELMGSRTLVLLDCGGQDVRVLVQGEPAAREGDRVGLALQLERAFYFAETGASLL